MEFFVSNSNVFFAFLSSLFISILGIPSIIRIADVKHLYDEPHTRKSHSSKVPTLGGIALFAGLMFGISFWVQGQDFFYMKFILSSVVLIFFTGIKDDIVNLVAWKKLVAQLVASIILVLLGDVRISGLYGLMGVYEIPFWLSVAISIVTITLITNSFNLIDGVNFLAGGVGVTTSLTFGTWFLIAGFNSFAVLAFALAGSLVGFLWYNKTPAKIFMGDTGSLLLGLVNSILAIKFIEINKSYSGQYGITSVPAVSISILIVPLFDTLRVMTIRILNGNSPLEADRNHLHHKLLDYGLTHMQVSFCLIGVNWIYILLGFGLMFIKGEFLMLIQISTAVVLTWITTHFARRDGGRIVAVDYCAKGRDVIQ